MIVHARVERCDMIYPAMDISSDDRRDPGQTCKPIFRRGRSSVPPLVQTYCSSRGILMGFDRCADRVWAFFSPSFSQTSIFSTICFLCKSRIIKRYCYRSFARSFAGFYLCVTTFFFSFVFFFFFYLVGKEICRIDFFSAANCSLAKSFIGNEHADLFKRLHKSSGGFRSGNLESCTDRSFSIVFLFFSRG